MPIQWYPGHMAKARKALVLAMPQGDVVVEVRDARAPRASANPVLEELRGKKPCVVVLAKADLADPDVTRAWVTALTTTATDGPRGPMIAMASVSARGGETRRHVIDLVRRLAPRPAAGLPKRPATRVLVVGVPNVGKSTLINVLAKRRVAKVGDEPAVTKAIQQVVLEEDLVLSDNPGILWPKLEDQESALRLGLTGALPDTALDFENVGHFAATFFLARYPAPLLARYNLAALPESPSALLEAIGRRRGCIKAGGVVDLHKAADHLIHDFRSGALGRVSLESP